MNEFINKINFLNANYIKKKVKNKNLNSVGFMIIEINIKKIFN